MRTFVASAKPANAGREHSGKISTFRVQPSAGNQAVQLFLRDKAAGIESPESFGLVQRSTEADAPPAAAFPEELNCSGKRKSTTDSAIKLAQKSVSKAGALLAEGDENTTELASQVFGPDQVVAITALLTEIEAKVGQLKAAKSGTPVLCGAADFQLCSSDVLAFVPAGALDEAPAESIILCPAFFKPVKGEGKRSQSQERARTILHETAHLILTDEPDVYIYQRLFSILPELGSEVALSNPDTIALFIMRAGSGVKAKNVEKEIATRRPPADRVEGFSASESLLVRSALGIVSASAGELKSTLATVIQASQQGSDFAPSLEPFVDLVTSLEAGLLQKAPSMGRPSMTDRSEFRRAKVLANLPRFTDAETGSHNVEVELGRRGFMIKRLPSGDVAIDGNEIGVGPGALPGAFVRSIPVQTSLTGSPGIVIEFGDRVDQATIGFVVRRLAFPLVKELSHLGEADLDKAIAYLIGELAQTQIVQRIAPASLPGAVLSKSAAEKLR